GQEPPRRGVAEIAGCGRLELQQADYACFIDRAKCRTKMTEIDATLVKQLIRARFPEWAELPVAPVENSGWDNKAKKAGKLSATSSTIISKPPSRINDRRGSFATDQYRRRRVWFSSDYRLFGPCTS